MKKYFLIGLTALCCVGGFAACDKEKYDGYLENTVVIEKLETDERYAVGAQIDLYANDKQGWDLSALQKTAQNIYLADETVAEIRDGYLYPKKLGVTYLVCERLDVNEYYNIVVHKDAAHVESVSVDGKTLEETSFCIGITYKLAAQTSSNCAFSELTVSVSSETEGAEAEEFLQLDETTGEMTVIGVGRCRVQITSTTNKKDEGVSFIVDSGFRDNTIKTAIDDYFLLHGVNKNESEGATYTRTELSTIEELCFLTLPTYQESYLKTIAPALKSVVYDLRQATAILDSRSITGDSLSYTFIGSAGTDYAFPLHVAAREHIALSFENIKMAGLDLSEVENAEINVKGECAFVGGEGNTVGEDGISAKNLKINLRKNTSLTCKGGNGSSTATLGARTGGAGIRANELEIDGTGDRTNLSISVCGGTGGNGALCLENGGQGGAGIDCAGKVFIKASIRFEATGGNGGTGSYGMQGSQPSARLQASSATSAGGKGDNGYMGHTGNQGGIGAKGGDSGAAIKADSFSMAMGDLKLFGGAGGTGGVGGKGGTGGTGGKGGNGCGGFWKDGDGGNGGRGGYGGKGGTGGTGGDSYYIVETNYFSITAGVFMEIFEGIGGNGGQGGQGGDGGRGGDGGNASTDTILDGSTNGDGGYGGQGGDGGDGGTTGVILCAFKNKYVVEIPTEILIHKADFAGFGGECGTAGIGGFGGDHGSSGDNGTSRWWDQASAGTNSTSKKGVPNTTRPEYPEDWTFIKFAE